MPGDGDESYRGPRENVQETNRLYVGGLAYQTTHDLLRNYFMRFGDVIDAVIMRDKETKKSRGFGFVAFSDTATADKVMRLAHRLDGRELQLGPADPLKPPAEYRQEKFGQRGGPGAGMSDGRGGGNNKGGDSRPPAELPRRVYIKDLDPDTSEDTLIEELGRQFGRVESAEVVRSESGQSRGFGFATFETEKSADTAIQRGQLKLSTGETVTITQARVKRKDMAGGVGGPASDKARKDSFMAPSRGPVMQAPARERGFRGGPPMGRDFLEGGGYSSHAGGPPAGWGPGGGGGLLPRGGGLPDYDDMMMMYGGGRTAGGPARGGPTYGGPDDDYEMYRRAFSSRSGAPSEGYGGYGAGGPGGYGGSGSQSAAYWTRWYAAAAAAGYGGGPEYYGGSGGGYGHGTGGGARGNYGGGWGGPDGPRGDLNGGPPSRRGQQQQQQQQGRSRSRSPPMSAPRYEPLRGGNTLRGSMRFHPY